MNLPLQQQDQEQEEKDQEQLHIDSVCDLPVQMRQDETGQSLQETNQMHLDLFKPHASGNNLLCESLSSSHMN